MSAKRLLADGRGNDVLNDGSHMSRFSPVRRVNNPHHIFMQFEVIPVGDFVLFDKVPSEAHEILDSVGLIARRTNLIQNSVETSSQDIANHQSLVSLFTL